MRKLGNGTRLEPNALSGNHDPGRRETATSPWGVLSGIVLSAWESHVHGEGPDGSTQPAKETRAGRVGLEPHEPTSLQGISNRAKASKDHRFQNLYRCLNAEFLRECWRDLNQDAASGVDGVTAAQYQEHLEENIQDLVRRLKTKCYRAKLVRRCYIPKENGTERPLGIPALEDKLVQLACAKLLNAIYEQDFLDFSNGYRPNRSAKETVADLTFNLQYGCYGYIVEADIKSFFDNLDQDRLLEMLAQRIDDRAFLHLIRQWLKAGILDTDGTILDSERGTPQGGVISPILANVYLHYALDLWFENVVKKHVRGEAMMCRYADDFVCAFRFEEDSESFYRVLPKRLGKFGLEVAPEKTRVLRFSRFHPSMKRRLPFWDSSFTGSRIGKGKCESSTGHRARSSRVPVGGSRDGSGTIATSRASSSSRNSTGGCKGITTTTGSGATANLSTASTSGLSSVRSNGSTEGAASVRALPGKRSKEHWTD